MITNVLRLNKVKTQQHKEAISSKFTVSKSGKSIKNKVEFAGESFNNSVVLLIL